MQVLMKRLVAWKRNDYYRHETLSVYRGNEEIIGHNEISLSCDGGHEPTSTGGDKISNGFDDELIGGDDKARLFWNKNS
jgi:hypothetical protein